MKRKISLRPYFKSKLFWPAIAVVLLIGCITFYILLEAEKAQRMWSEEELTKTFANKRVVEKNLIETILAKRKVEKDLEERNRQLELALVKVEEEITTRREAEGRLIMALEENRLLKTQIRRYVKRPEGIELEEIAVVKFAPIMEGEVLAVNKDYDFIVINLGKDSDIKLGQILSVYRGDEFIGSVRIEKIKKDNCAAGILSNWKNVEFKEGDRVKRI